MQIFPYQAKYYLKAPIYVTLEFEEDKVIASFDDIEAFSYADTASEATNLFSDEIIQIFEDKKKLRRNTRQLPVTAKTTEFVVHSLIAGLIFVRGNSSMFTVNCY